MARMATLEIRGGGKNRFQKQVLCNLKRGKKTKPSMFGKYIRK